MKRTYLHHVEMGFWLSDAKTETTDIARNARAFTPGVWREKDAAGESIYVFFGLRPDIEVAHYLTELIDAAVRAELGRFKTSADYGQLRRQERHLANASRDAFKNL